MNYYKTIFRGDYKPMLSFYDKLCSVAQAFRGYPDWWTDRLSVTLQNFELHCSVQLAHSWYVYAQDAKGDSDEDDRRIREVIEVVASSLPLTEYKRVGFRRIYFYPVSMEFENLVLVVADKLFVQNEQVKAGICPRPEDVAYAVDFGVDSAKIKLRAGPVRGEELERHLQPDRNNNFPVKERFLPANEIYSGLEVGLLVDLDYGQETVKANETLDFYNAAVAFHEKLTKNIVSYIFGLGN